MAKSKRRQTRAPQSGGFRMRMGVVGVALLLAAWAAFVLFRGGGLRGGEGDSDARDRVPPPTAAERRAVPENAPALDDIDARSRAKMRELLRQAGEEE